MKPQDQIPYGAMVETTRVVEIYLANQSAYKVVPAGTRGIVGTGRAAEGAFNFEDECPVIIEHWVEHQLSEVIGIPWDALELIDESSSP